MKSRRQGLLIASVVAVALVVPVLAAVFSTSDDPKQPPPTPSATAPVYGDGLASEAHDFRLANLQLPSKARRRGIVSFEILDAGARPVTAMIRERSTLVHLYVVRDDYSVYRHLYPRPANGTWSAPLTLPAGGTYRAIAEFTVDAGNHNDHIYLAGEASLPDSTGTGPQMDSKDGAVEAALEGTDRASETGWLRLQVNRRGGGHAKLASAVEVTAFHQLTGTIVRLLPARPPTVDGDASTFQLPTTGFRLAGLYMFFVDVPVGGKVHTLRIVEQVG